MASTDSLPIWSKIDSGTFRLEYLGLLPATARMALVVAIGIGLLMAGWWLHLADRQAAYRQALQQEVDVKEKYKDEALRLADFARLQQAQQIQKTHVNTFMRTLAGRMNVSRLIDDITRAGLDSGLDFAGIVIGTQATGELYTELPIQVQVRGGYHDIGAFCSRLAALPYAMTAHDFRIQPAQPSMPVLDATIELKAYSRITPLTVAAL